MCRRLMVFTCLAAIAPLYNASQATGNDESETISVADGTPVHLVLMDDLQGGKLREKQPVHFVVREDLVINSRLVVKTGSDAIGHVETVSKNGLLGKSGRLVLQFDFVNTVSGGRINLRGTAGVSGGKGGALTWESALWYGPAASLSAGTMINAYVDQNQMVKTR